MNEQSITYKKLTRTDVSVLAELIKLYAAVFETENFILPNKAYLQQLLDKDHIVFYVALLNNVVVGGLTAYVLASVYYPSNEVYIYDLAVTQNKQRQGIATKLILFLKNDFAALGYREMYVQANMEDQHAIDFYKATGAHAEPVIHFSYNLTNR